LEDELTPDVPLEEITLTCNPYYRYGKNKSEDELERLLLADTMREYVSYAVGCIFGRYSLDKDGLVLANAGDDIEEYYRQIPEPTFVPDESGILPVTADEDYADDLPSQFRSFLRTTFGDQHYRANISFIEEAVGKDIRGYFLKNFYSDHVKRYKKRPIYWMISSPNGSFKALIYLHRYHKDTINRFLNDYLRPYQQKIKAKIENNAHIIDSGSYGTTEKNRAQKQITEYEKQLKELYTWEKDVVYPLASQRIELDLDDGVKVNYGKLGAILDKVKGLND
jgi:type II restriction/modification system DNA methylase subunit YeeA